MRRGGERSSSFACEWDPCYAEMKGWARAGAAPSLIGRLMVAPSPEPSASTATRTALGPPSETLPFPVVDARTSGEQLVLLQGAHVSDSQPIALALFRQRPLPAAVLAWTPGRVLLLTLALSSSSSSLPVAHAPKPTSSPPPADNPPNGRIHISTLRIRRPWLPVALSSDRLAPLSTSPQALRSLARFSESRTLFQKQYRSIVAITSNLTVAYQRRRRSF
ncbi:hypothetical protein IG631_02245 [Alternaria alternata]|nr:hypothetical protein IG631_02245 [Alternaria alternata]